jgi:hypothetical protein
MPKDENDSLTVDDKIITIMPVWLLRHKQY